MSAADYQGEHSSPGRDSGSPLSDLTANGTYPDDVYSSDGGRLYTEGSGRDHEVMGLVRRSRGKPNRRVKVYRAVPHAPSIAERIEEVEAEKRQVLKRGKSPGMLSYDALCDVIERLKRLPEVERPKLRITPGDWVALVRSYAADHGRSALNGEYKIVTKTVRAGDLYTAGDSLQEWGWDPAVSRKSNPGPSGTLLVARLRF